MDSSNNWQNKRVFSKKDDSGNVGNKGLRREEQNNQPKKVISSGDWTWDPKTPLVAHLVLHSCAFLTELTWQIVKRGIFNFTFVGAPIDFWT